MQGFLSRGLLRFVFIFSAIFDLFVLFVAPSANRPALTIHIHRLQAMVQWKAATGTLA